MRWGGLFYRLILSLGIFSLVAGFNIANAPSVSADCDLNCLLKKQADLQKQAEESKKKIEQKKKEASNLQDMIAGLNDDISYTESRIANTETQISLTNQVIAELQVNINQNQELLNQLNAKLRSAYTHLYELSRTSTIEMILQSNSITDALTQAQYVQSLQDSLQKDINKTNQLMAELNAKKKEGEDQKASLENLNTDLNNQRSSLGRKRNQKSYLLGVTQGEQAKYEKLLEQIKNESGKVSEEIYRKRLELGGSGGGTGGYPYADGPSDVPDPWGFLTRECTSYAAWKWNEVIGHSWYRGEGPPGTGNAKNWPNLAGRNEATIGSSPRVGAIVVWGYGWVNTDYINPEYGHVAIVEVVHSSSDIEVSDYNWKAYAYYYHRLDPNLLGAPTYIYP